MPDKVKVSQGGFSTILGLSTTKNSDPEKRPGDTSFLGRYTQAELKSYLNNIYVPPQNAVQTMTAAGISSFVRPIHQKIGTEIIDAKRMAPIAPEIDQCKMIMSSAIISPNDLQNGEFIFSFNNVPALVNDKELGLAIAELYSKFFNNTLKFNIKMKRFIQEIMYESGAKPILILPQATQIDVRNRTAEQAAANLYQFGPGFASFEDFMTKQTTDDEFFYSNKRITWNDVFNKESPREHLQDIIPAMESYQDLKIPNEFRSKDVRAKATDNSELYGEKYTEGLESMIVNLRTRLQEGQVIKVTENPDTFNFIKVNKDAKHSETLAKLKEKFKQRPIFPEEVVQLEANPEGIAHRGHPNLIELPTESVVPIFVPGSPAEHIGYFVLLDQYGQPLTIETSGMAVNGNCLQSGNGANPSAAYDAVFGQGCCGSRYFDSYGTAQQMGKVIFNNLLEKYLRSRMEGITGRYDLDIGRFNSIAGVMFYRLLACKQTTLVWVPPELMTYFAFDYNDDGTGKSKISQIQFLLSLRTTFLIAQVLAMANDAVEHRKITFDLDDKNANPEGLMDLIANTFISKAKVSGSIDPSEIISDITANALTISPRNLPGLANNFNVETEVSGGNSVKPDDQLLDKISALMSSALDVNQSTLNQLQEPEFAKSIVTSNLLTTLKVSSYQDIVCAQTTDFVKLYTQYDPIFQKSLFEVIQAYGKKKSKEKVPPKTQKMKNNNPNLYQRKLSTLVSEILTNVEVSLPSPKIAVDKAQFEELRNFTSMIDELTDKVLSPEMIPSSAPQEVTESYNLYRSKFKRDATLKFLEKSGGLQLIDIPSEDDIDPVDFTDFIQVFQNLSKAVTGHQKAMMSDEAENGGQFGDSGYGDEGGGGDEFGGDDGFGEDTGGGEDYGDEGEDFSEGSVDDMKVPGADEAADIPDASSGGETAGEGEGEGGSTATMYYDLLHHKK